MSALGQTMRQASHAVRPGHSRRFDRVQLTSGLTPQADIIADRRHVSKVKVPIGDITRLA
jgi:hypothetical protein